MLGTDRQIGRYEIKHRLAYGGMGTLYLAHDPVLERTVALKLFHADLERPDARDRFVREARAVAALNNPNIVTIYDYGEYSSQPFLVMEYIQGETLAELIRRRPVLHTVVKVRWMEELCAAVGYAHDRGIIHRDIKPANLMIDGYGRIKVLDFGIAQMRGTLVTNATGLVGTPGYTAPEQIRGSAVDRRSDLFSIGVVCYELFSFVEPFAAESTHAMSHRILHEDPTPLETLQPSLDPELTSVVARALRRDPEQRLVSAEAMRNALAAVRRRLETAEPDTTMSYVPPARDQTVAASKPTGPAPAGAGAVPVPGSTPAAGRPSEGAARTPRRATRESLARQREEQIQGWIQLAREHAAAGEKSEARDACAQALKLEPAHADALALLGSLERITAARRDRPVDAPTPADVAALPAASVWAATSAPIRAGAGISATPQPLARVEAPASFSPVTTAAVDAGRLHRTAGRWPAVRKLLVPAGAVAALLAAATIAWMLRTPASGSAVLVVIDASPWANVEAVRGAAGTAQPLPAGASTPLALSLAPGSYKVVLVGPPPASERREVALQVAADSTPRLFEPFAPMTVDRYLRRRRPVARRQRAGARGTETMRAVRRNVGLVAITGVLLAGAVAAQDVKRIDDVFKKGIEALDDEEWANAIKYFQEALRLDPKESPRKIGRNIFGLFGNEYLPHLRIGQAYLGLKDCAKALAEWEESERQGVVKKSEDGLEILEDGQDDCKKKGFLTLAEYRAEMQRAQGALKEAGDTEQIIAGLAGVNPDVVAGDLKALYERARADLSGARTKLGDAEQTRKPQAMTEAIAAAENARRALESARAAVTRAVSNAPSPPGPSPAGVRPSPAIAEAELLVESVGRAAQTVATTLSSSPVPLTVPGEVAGARQRAQASLDDARSRLAAARKSGAESEFADVRRLASEAQTQFAKVQADIDRLRTAAVESELKTLNASGASAFAAADARMTQVQGILSSRPPAADASRANTQLKKAQASLGRARKDFDQALASGDVGAARSARAAIGDVNRQLDVLGGLLGTVVVTPVIPDTLKSAAQAFFDGRYDEVVKTLTDEAVQSMATPLRVHAHALRAASLFARYEYSNRRDESLRAAARQNVDASRHLDPAFQPNPAAFAPKFIAFFSEAVTVGR